MIWVWFLEKVKTNVRAMTRNEYLETLSRLNYSHHEERLGREKMYIPQTDKDEDWKRWGRDKAGDRQAGGRLV